MIDLRQEILAGNVLIREAEQSQNFVSGVSGWQIKADGNAEFNNINIRGSGIFGPNPGKHIEINTPGHLGEIAFFTGVAEELAPSVLQPDAVANQIGIQFRSAETAADNLGSALTLYTHKFAATNSQAHLSSQGQVLIDAARDVSIECTATGDFIDLNDPAGFLLQGGAVDIYDQSLTVNRGVRVTNGYMQPLDLNTWQNITQLSAMTGGTAFVNSWTDVAGSRFRAYKDATGRVTLEGRVISGTANTIFTLPVGWRPTTNLEFTSHAAGAVTLCAFSISTTGVVAMTVNQAAAGTNGMNIDMASYPTT